MIGSAARDGVGVITIDNSPVNAVGPGVPGEIGRCLAEAENDPAIRAVVLIEAGRTFIAGADIHQIGRPGGIPRIDRLLVQLENRKKPLDRTR